jgi:SAM-dependent methyltransferase
VSTVQRETAASAALVDRTGDMSETTAPAKEASCRSCGSPKVSVFLSLGDLPLSDGFVSAQHLSREDKRYPLDVAFCQDCTMVQILETVPPETLFDDEYPYFSSFTDSLLRHSAAHVAERIEDRRLGDTSLVVELASNDGYLLQYYAKEGIPVLGIDPAKGPVEAARKKGVDTIHAFFTRDLAEKLAKEGRRADVIHANNVLAHVADTNGFVAGIGMLLKEDGLAVIEAPYVRWLIEHGEFDTIYHEHLCYFSVHSLDNLFRRHNLYVNRLEPQNIHGGTLRIFVGKQDAPDQTVKDHLAEEKKLGIDTFDYYEHFSERVNSIRSELSQMLGDLKKQGKRIVGYGAAAKGTIMLNYVGIGRDTLDFVVDRNTHKQGRYVPGVRLPIEAPARILETQPDYVLILPWNFKEEIMDQQSEYRTRGGRFIVPVPRPAIL